MGGWIETRTRKIKFFCPVLIHRIPTMFFPEFRDTVFLRAWVETSRHEPPWPRPLFHPLPAVWQPHPHSLESRWECRAAYENVNQHSWSLGMTKSPVVTWSGRDWEVPWSDSTRLTHPQQAWYSEFPICFAWLCLGLHFMSGFVLTDKFELIQLWDSEHTHQRSVQAPFSVLVSFPFVILILSLPPSTLMMMWLMPTLYYICAGASLPI